MKLNTHDALAPSQHAQCHNSIEAAEGSLPHLLVAASNYGGHDLILIAFCVSRLICLEHATSPRQNAAPLQRRRFSGSGASSRVRSLCHSEC